jgi:MinD superfamily P-loop ATPase
MAADEQVSRRATANYLRYHIETKDAPALASLPPRFRLKHLNNCVDVGECAEVCVYEVHKMTESKISDPIEDRCRGCFLCYLRCPENAISLQVNPEFKKLGNSYFTPERIETIYFEAETG